MFIGYYQLGDILPISVWTRDATGTPAEPDASPVVHVVDSSGENVAALAIPVVDSENVTGFFMYRMNLDAAFSAGYHTVVVNYAISSNQFAAIAQFEIVPGGDNEGNGIAMHFFQQPAADYVLLQTDRGALKRLRNPSVRGV